MPKSRASSDNDYIQIEGARENNLKGINLKIPLNKITCLTGPSGSGKSSIAFHTLVAESKRRLMNCFSNDLRFFSEKPARVDIEKLSPVLPVFGLQQINPVKGSRTNISDSLGLTHHIQALFFYNSAQKCSKHDVELEKLTLLEQLKAKVEFQDTDKIHFYISKENFLEIWGKNILPPRSLSGSSEINPFNPKDPLWEVLRIKGKNAEKINNAFKDVELSNISRLYIFNDTNKKLATLEINKNLSCPICGEEGLSEPSEYYFSPFNAQGACNDCNGFGANLLIDESRFINFDLSINDKAISFFKTDRFKRYESDFYQALKAEKVSFSQPIKKLPAKFKTILFKGKGKWPGLKKIENFLESKKYKPGIRILLRNLQSEFDCKTCDSSRITSKVKNFKVLDVNIHKFMNLNVKETLNFIKKIKVNDTNDVVLESMISQLEMASKIGLGHLKLSRKTKSLSSGEYQRVLLVKYLSFKGTNSLFVFDEPSVGLDKDQVKTLFKGFEQLKEQGNTVLLVEHNNYFIGNSDLEVKVGPGSGIHGGEIIYEGKPKKTRVKKSNLKIKKLKAKQFLKVKEVTIYDKVYQNIEIPLERLTWVSGKAGTGKSSVIKEAIFNQVNFLKEEQYLYKPISKIKGLKFPNSLESINILDSNLNRYTSRSTVGSMTDLVKSVRKYYSKLGQAQILGLGESDFSPNSKAGQCLKCEGRGYELFELSYLENITVKCDECQGRGIKFENSEINDGIQSFYEAISEPLENILSRIPLTAKYRLVFDYLKKLNLGHLCLNRKMSSLSGGEKQRMQLLSKILKVKKGQVFVLENISFGLSIKELSSVLEFLRDLTLQGQSIIVIDHHPIMAQYADYQLEFLQGQQVNLNSL